MTRVLLCVMLSATLACSKNSNSPSSRTPAYGGTWSGNYSVSSCSQTGQIASLVNICGAATTGTLLPYTFQFTQSERTVAGQFLLGQLTFPFGNTTIASDGALTISGVNTSGSSSVNANWSLHLVGSSLTGTVSQTWTSSGLTGNAIFGGPISSALKTAASAFVVPIEPRTLREALDMIAR